VIGGHYNEDWITSAVDTDKCRHRECRRRIAANWLKNDSCRHDARLAQLLRRDKAIIFVRHHDWREYFPVRNRKRFVHTTRRRLQECLIACEREELFWVLLAR
jgi:hypothetical protein